MSNLIVELNQQVALLCEQGQFKSAVPLARRSLRLARRELGDRAEDTAISANNLGLVYLRIGDLCLARRYLRYAAATFRRALGDTHEETRNSLVTLGSLYEEMQDYTGALRLGKRALALCRRDLGPEHPETAKSLNRVGFLLRGLGKYKEAQRFYRRALAVARKVDPGHPETAICLNNLGAALESAHDYAGAVACYRRALKILRKTLGDEDPATAGCRDNLKGARRLLACPRTDERPAEAPPPPEPPPVLDSAPPESADHAPGEPAHLQLRVYADGTTYSIDFYDSLESPYYRVNLTESFRELKAGLGNAYHLTPLSPYFTRCAGCSYLILTNRPHGYGLACQKCGHRGNTAPVHRPDLDGLLAEARKAFDQTGEGVPGTTWSAIKRLREEGGAYLEEEAFDRAYHALRECSELAERHLVPADPHLVRIRHLLGRAHMGLGQFAEALAVYGKMRDAVREARGEECEEYETALDGMATAYFYAGQHLESLRLYQQILESRGKRFGFYHHSYALALDNVCAVFNAMGVATLAVKYCKMAVSVFRETRGEDHPEFAIALDNLGRLYQGVGQHKKAEPLHRKALRVLRECDRAGAAGYALRHLAYVYSATGRPRNALPLVREAAVIAERFIWQVFGLSSEARRLAHLESVRDDFDSLLSVVLRCSAAPEAAPIGYDLVLGRKALVLESVAAQRDAALGGRYPQLGDQLRRLAELRMQIAEKALAGPPRGEEAQHRQQLTEWESRRDSLEADLARQIPELDLRQGLRAADRSAIARGLPPGSALIEFIQCVAINPPPPADVDEAARWSVEFASALEGVEGRHSWQGPPRLLAFVLLAGEPEGVRLFDLGEAASIDRLVAEFRAAVTGDPHVRAMPADPVPKPGWFSWLFGRRARHLQPQQVSPAPKREAGLRLRRAVLDPLREALGGRTRLFLAPDGSLTRLPFEALPQDDGSPLLTHYQISYLGTGRDVVRFSAPRQGEAAPPLVVADPDFDLTAGPVATQATELQPRRSKDVRGADLCFAHLPGTRKEGEQLAGLLNVRPHMGAAAVERLVKGTRAPRLLHLATHGFFLSDQGRDPGSVGPGLPGEGDFRRLRGPGLENPLLRSGLALAGANTWLRHGAAPEEAEDGLLTAEDVAGLDLTCTEMVVLSACETGLGEVRNGEGVYGLRRSFTLAGARTLVMSLWKVPDAQTQELMVEFYKQVLRGATRVDALREAQLALHARNMPPYYWGAFVCQGDPGPLPTRNP